MKDTQSPASLDVSNKENKPSLFLRKYHDVINSILSREQMKVASDLFEDHKVIDPEDSTPLELRQLHEAVEATPQLFT